MSFESTTYQSGTSAATSAIPMPRVLHSRLLARLLSPALAILPWWITVMGVARLSAWQYPLPGDSGLGPVLTAAAFLLVAAVLWALVSAWSATGPLLAGVCTVWTAVFLATREGQLIMSRLTLTTDVDFMRTTQYLAHPGHSVVVGCLLLAAGLGAAGARRLSR